MFEVHVELLMCGLNPITDTFLVYSADSNKLYVPRMQLSIDDDPVKLAELMFTGRCELDVKWAAIFEAGFTKVEDKLTLHYGTVLPWDTKFNHGLMVSIEKVEDEALLNTLTKIAQKI